MTRREDRTPVDRVLHVLAEEGFEGMAEAIAVLMNEAMKLERIAFLGAEPHERTESRRGHANGYKPKRVKTRVGEVALETQRVPDRPIGDQLLDRTAGLVMVGARLLVSVKRFSIAPVVFESGAEVVPQDGEPTGLVARFGGRDAALAPRDLLVQIPRDRDVMRRIDRGVKQLVVHAVLIEVVYWSTFLPSPLSQLLLELVR